MRLNSFKAAPSQSPVSTPIETNVSRMGSSEQTRVVIHLAWRCLLNSTSRIGVRLRSRTSSYFAVAAALFLGLFPTLGMAAPGYVKGVVELIRTHNAEMHPGWAPPKFWFTLKGVNQAGNCPKWANGSVLFVMNDKQALAMILSAQASMQEVAVYFTDDQLSLGWCTASFITLGSPAPLY